MAKTVRDIIKDRKEVYCLSNQTTVAEAARFLKDRGIRATGVCNLSGKIVGVDNGNAIDTTTYTSLTRNAFSGKVVAIVQSTGAAGTIAVTATSSGLATGSVSTTAR